MIGENKNFVGGEAYLRQRGVEVVVLDNAECTGLMDKFIEEKPELWYVHTSNLSTRVSVLETHFRYDNCPLTHGLSGTRILALRREFGPRRARRRLPIRFV